MVSGMIMELPMNSQCDELDEPSPACIQMERYGNFILKSTDGLFEMNLNKQFAI